MRDLIKSPKCHFSQSSLNSNTFLLSTNLDSTMANNGPVQFTLVPYDVDFARNYPTEACMIRFLEEKGVILTIYTEKCQTCNGNICSKGGWWKGDKPLPPKQLKCKRKGCNTTCSWFAGTLFENAKTLLTWFFCWQSVSWMETPSRKQ